MIRVNHTSSMNDQQLHASLTQRIHRGEIARYWQLLMGIEGTLATIQSEIRELTELLRTSNTHLPPNTTPQNTIDPELAADLMELLEELNDCSNSLN